MTSDKQPPATLESLVRMVIEAQVKGGYNHYDPFLSDRKLDFIAGYVKTGVSIMTGGYSSAHILEILFDTEGAKAAYRGTGVYRILYECYEGDNVYGWTRWHEEEPGRLHVSVAIVHRILDAWNSGPGNNLRAALETAVAFLPKP